MSKKGRGDVGGRPPNWADGPKVSRGAGRGKEYVNSEKLFQDEQALLRSIVDEYAKFVPGAADAVDQELRRSVNKLVANYTDWAGRRFSGLEG